mgnify:CR=1 FL=1
MASSDRITCWYSYGDETMCAHDHDQSCLPCEHDFKHMVSVFVEVLADGPAGRNEAMKQ